VDLTGASESGPAEKRRSMAENSSDMRDLPGSTTALCDKMDASFKALCDNMDASFADVQESISRLSAAIERDSADLRVVMAMHDVCWFVIWGGALAFIAGALKSI
jgi:hypothetical protein